MDALGCEQVIERPGGRGKLKLRGRSAVLGLSARAARILGIAKTIVLVRTGRRFRNVVRRQMCETPRCSHGRPFGCADRRSGHWRRWQVVLPFGLSLPVAWLDSYGRRRHVGPWSQEFSPAGFPPQAGTPTGIPRACACGAKIRGSGRGAALRLPSARLWRLRLCFVFPAMNGSPSQRGTAPQDGER